MQSDPDTVPRALNYNLGKSRKLKATAKILSHPEIFMEFLTIVLALGIPLRPPVTVDYESESDGIYFLSHNTWCWGKGLSLLSFLLHPRPLRPRMNFQVLPRQHPLLRKTHH